MKKLMIATAAATFLAASSFAAFAAEVTGSITTIDVAAGTIALNNGKTYQLAATQDSTNGATGTTKSTATPAVLASFKAGDKVTIKYDEVDGKFMASGVAAAM